MGTATKDRSKAFFKDFGIYSIGQISAKVVQFLLVPLYTYFIPDRSSFGYYDLCMTLSMMMIPVITLQLRDTVFRFMYNETDPTQRKRVLTFITSAFVSNVLLMTVIACIIALTWKPAYMWYTFAVMVLMSTHEIYIQAIRGIHLNKVYVVMSVCLILLVGLLSALFVGVLQFGIKGIFLAMILGRIIVLSITELKIGVFRKYFSIKLWSLDMARPIFKFCLPLIPNSISWWIIMSSSRFFMVYFCGLDTNGIYAVAYKFSAVVVLIAGIFYQTWQETALREYDSPDRDSFFSKVFNSYICVLTLCFTGYMAFIKMNFGWLVGPNYHISLKYVLPLGLTSIMYAVTMFFEMGYQGAKQTYRAVPSVLTALAISLTLNTVLIKHYAIWGSIISAFVCFAVMIVYRWHDTNRYFYHLSFYPRTLIPMAIAAVSAIPFYCFDSVWLETVSVVILLFIGVYFSPPLVSDKVKRLLRIRQHSQSTPTPDNNET